MAMAEIVDLEGRSLSVFPNGSFLRKKPHKFPIFLECCVSILFFFIFSDFIMLPAALSHGFLFCFCGTPLEVFTEEVVLGILQAVVCQVTVSIVVLNHSPRWSF